MSSLQDENSFSAGGGTEAGQTKKQIVQVTRPDPTAVAAAVTEQIARAKESAAGAKQNAKAIFAETKSEITKMAGDVTLLAKIKREFGVLEASVPIIVQEIKIDELERE